MFGVAGRPARAHRAADRRRPRALLPHLGDRPPRAQPLPEPDLPADRRRPRWRSTSPAPATRPRSARSCCCCVRAGNNGQQAQTAYQGLRQSLPFIERLQARRSSATRGAPRWTADAQLPRIDSLALRATSRSPTAPSARCSRRSASRSPAGEAIGIVGPSGAGKSTLVQILLRLRAPGGGPLPGQRRPRASSSRASEWHRLRRLRPPGTAAGARLRRGEHPLLPRPRRRGGRTGRRGWRASTTTSSAGRRGTTRSSARAPTRSPAASSSASASRARSRRDPQVLVLDEPTSALDPHSER